MKLSQNFISRSLSQNSMEGSKMETIKNFIKDESGASAVEYGLLVALIAVVLIAAVSALGTSISQVFSRVSTTMATVGS
jgi:pilus assembly protein Flp/PilA